MDDQQSGGGGGYTPPAGLTPVGAPQAVPQGYQPPAGLTPVGAPQPISGASDTSSQHGLQDVADDISNAPTNLYKGIAKGVLSTTSGLGDIIHKVGEYVHPGLGEALIPSSGLTAEEAYSHPHGAAQTAGYGGETLMEFMMGDEALKTLSTADKALAVGKTLKTVEKSPKLMQALKLGAKELAAQSARAGAVQGAQTFVRTGGDVSEAAKAGLETAGTTAALGGVIGGAAGLIGKGASEAGKAAQSAGELADTAANAPDKQTLAENIQGQLQNSKTALHENYETKTKDFETRLKGQTIDPKTAPIANKADEILQKPDPEDHSSVAQLKDIRGEKLDKPVREFLENTAEGKQSLSQEDIDKADETNANKPKLLDAQGKPLEIDDVEPEAQDQEPHDAHSLIQWRQQVRALASEYPPGDVNARALNRLLWDGADHSSAFDDTFSQLADKSGDTKAVGDYQALRNDYRSKINVYDNPVIKNLMEGKPDDAAKAFIATKSASGLPTGGKTEFNVGQLRTVLGDQGFTHFRDSVFENLLKTASDEKSGFNPAKFVDSWSRIADGTKQEFFGAHDPSVLPQNYVTSLVQPARTAANFQKLVRAGLIGGTAATAGTIAPVAGAGLGTVLAFVAGHEGAGGIAKGRDILDYVANHPRTWAAFRKMGAAADNGAAGKVANGATQVGKVIGNQVATSNENDAKDKSALQRIMQGPAQSLSGQQ